ncbi:MAG: hypothetical protein D6806_07545, partial [Deltaproteobacteria bacterium]
MGNGTEGGTVELARQLKAYLEWLREMGITALPAGLPVPEAGSAQADAKLASTPSDAALPRAEHAPEGSPGQETAAGDRARQQDLFGVSSRAQVSPAGPADPAEAQQALDRIRDEIGDCKLCRLHEQRTNIVFGEGNPAARLVFAGEGPGRDEDATGRP